MKSNEPAGVLKGFDYQDVELKNSLWKRQRDETIELYLAMDNDDILHDCRVNAGLPSDRDGLPGWGPSIGQYFGSYSKLYSVTGDYRLKRKAVSLFEGWAECIDKDSALLENDTYGYEKLIGGLLDMYEYMGHIESREMISRLTDHAISDFDPTIPRDGIQDGRLKGQIEWYTLPENLYRAFQLFGDEKYRTFAEQWHYDYMWDKILAHDFDIGPRHAYSHVNCLSSAARAYEVTNDSKYLEIMKIAYEEITRNHTYATGGYGPAETLFIQKKGYLGFMLQNTWDFRSNGDVTYRNFAGDLVARSDVWGSCEVSCCAWAVFKFCRYLLRHTGEAKYAEWAERMLYNATGGQPPITPDGKILYYASYFTDGAMKSTTDRRLFFGGRNFTWQCCTGTFPQDVAEYANMLYYHDDDGLYISQYLPSHVHWKKDEVAVGIENYSSYPRESAVRLRISTESPVAFKLKLRVPSWATRGYSVFVNGSRVHVDAPPDSWIVLDRVWKDGDLVDVDFTWFLYFKAVDDHHPNLVALLYGPIVLVSTEMTLLVGDVEHPEDWIQAVSGEEMVFRTEPGHTGELSFIRRTFVPYFTYPENQWYFMYISTFRNNEELTNII